MKNIPLENKYMSLIANLIALFFEIMYYFVHNYMTILAVWNMKFLIYFAGLHSKEKNMWYTIF